MANALIRREETHREKGPIKTEAETDCTSQGTVEVTRS